MVSEETVHQTELRKDEIMDASYHRRLQCATGS